MRTVATTENTVRNTLLPTVSPNAMPGFSVNVNRNSRPTTGIDSPSAIWVLTTTFVIWSRTTMANVIQRTRMFGR